MTENTKSKGTPNNQGNYINHSLGLILPNKYPEPNPAPHKVLESTLESVE